MHEMHELVAAKSFFYARLGMSERAVATATWPEVSHRIVTAQQSTTRLCTVKDLSEHDIVSRIMRKENYLIGMLNKGVLALHITITPPKLLDTGSGKKTTNNNDNTHHQSLRHQRHVPVWNQTLEWNLYFCLLHPMFDEYFKIKPSFLRDEEALSRRFKIAAIINLLAAPFIFVFLLTYFFLKNAERFYHHPSSVGARRWSAMAYWKLREFNELPHFLNKRLDSSQAAAERYVSQFPSPIIAHTARFLAFVAGSFAALLLFAAAIDESLLERSLGGRQIVWWVAVTGIVLAISRAFIEERGTTVFDPEMAMMEVVAHTHFLPRHWRGRAHTREVQQQFQSLFQFKATLFLEELAAVILTPILLWYQLPKCSKDIITFVQTHTRHVDGVGDVCSFSVFDFEQHGNVHYGAPTTIPPSVPTTTTTPTAMKSRQGKMEKSFVSFAATYPYWEPSPAGKQLLKDIAMDSPTTTTTTTNINSNKWGGGPHELARLQAVVGLLSAQYPHLRRLYGLHDKIGTSGGGGGFASIMHPHHHERQEDCEGERWDTGSLFKSAEFTGRFGGAFDYDDDVFQRMRIGQMMLQSVYEERTTALGHVTEDDGDEGGGSGGRRRGRAVKDKVGVGNTNIETDGDLFQYHQHQQNPPAMAVPIKSSSPSVRKWSTGNLHSTNRDCSNELSLFSRSYEGTPGGGGDAGSGSGSGSGSASERLYHHQLDREGARSLSEGQKISPPGFDFFVE